VATAAAAGKTRRWSRKSQIQRPAARPNQFGPVAGSCFFYPLLAGWDRPAAAAGRRLVDSDLLLLGRALAALAEFVVCAGHAPAARGMARALLELLAGAAHVRLHREAHVRRCALGALLRVAVAAAGGGGGGGGGSAPADGALDDAGAAAVNALAEWAAGAAAEDPDPEAARLGAAASAALAERERRRRPTVELMGW
jgi:hypothetical protein